MPKKAETPEDVPKSYLECRSFRHQQQRFVTDKATRGTQGQIVEFTRVMKCALCSTEIHTTYSLPGWRVLKRKYIHPDNYGVKGGFPVSDARDAYIIHRFTA